MHAVLAQHFAHPEKVQQAQEGVLKFGLALRSFSGFIGRHTVIDSEDATRILSITLWRNKTCYEAWQNSPTRIGFTERHSHMWSRATERSTYDSIDEL